jgi:hypothetical protein
MDLVPSDAEKGLKVPIWSEYQEILDLSEGKSISIEKVSPKFIFPFHVLTYKRWSDSPFMIAQRRRIALWRQANLLFMLISS